MVDNSVLGGRLSVAFDRNQELVAAAMREFGQMQFAKSTTASHCEEIAELILPTSRNTFFYQSYNFPGQKKTDRQVDATGMMALHRFAAICDSLLTPRNMLWHGLAADNDYVMKDRNTKLWFEEVSRILFKQRYAPLANFSSQNQNCYQSLGAFGNLAMFVDPLDGKAHHGARGLRYRGVPFGEIYFRESHQGIVDGFIRWFRLTAYQAGQKWGLENLPAALQTGTAQNSQMPFNFLHRVVPRDDGSYEPDRLDARGKPYISCYISIEGQCLLQPEGGYRSFPMAVSRYDQTPGEVYGRGPAGLVLPSLKTLNLEKRLFLKAGHRAADPILLASDDGIVDGFNLTPGFMNKGGMSPDGKPRIGTLPVGDIQITKEMMAEERSLINDAFLVTLFQILTETPQMTATEVIERTNEKGILLAPTIGRQQSEYLGPLVERELDVLASQSLLPPMPPRLREAGGEYQLVYTSPLARAQRAQEAAGFYRTVEVAKEIVAITQDPSYLDRFQFDRAIPAIAEIQSVPTLWMASDDEVAAKQKNRAQQAKQQQAIQAAPARAAMMKAQAVMMKAGGPQEQQVA